jgi:DNA-binding response OmpR family regulator
MDQTMPNIPGLQLAKELTRIRRDIAIIICTGYSELISQGTEKAMGIQACLMKPLVIRELAETVRMVLDRSRGPFKDIVDKAFLQNTRNFAHSDIVQ